MGGKIDGVAVMLSKRKSNAEAQRALRLAAKFVETGCVAIHAGIIDT
jgi:hypothetical protein